jgi:hypothetical protein
MLAKLPAEVQATIREFRTCEFATMTRAGTPIAWPVGTLYQADHGRFQLTTSIAFPQKAFNVRRNPHVSLLFSDPTGSGLAKPPTVLVQGWATAPDEVVTGVEATREYWRDAIYSRQPASEQISSNFLTRKLMDWYYMRIVIYVSPVTVHWWSAGDFSQQPQKVEVQNHVG